MKAFIFARGGSKGIPKKNIADINGVSLLAKTVVILRNTEGIDDIYISTDCEEIKGHAEKLELRIIDRPTKLATDHANEIDSWIHMCETLGCKKDEPFIVTPVTSPLRNQKDIKEGIIKWSSKKYDIIMTKKESSRNPYLNMITEDNRGVLNILPYEKKIWRRQDAPKFWDVLTVFYITTYGRIMQSKDLISERTGWVEIPNRRAIDIDTPFDLELARYLETHE